MMNLTYSVYASLFQNRTLHFAEKVSELFFMTTTVIVRLSQLNVVFNKELVDVPGESFLLVIVDKLVVGPIGADGDDRKVSCFVP